MVFYRKYRPQTIEELDSEEVRKTLHAVFKDIENIPHAFLFTGSKGLGKTSTARIVAKVVNCQNKKKGSIEPCNTCEMCVSITNGSNLDVMEIDAASNRGIDEIRELREKIKLAPLSANKKAYIIDEVHMLTTEAFNALLKTLEEPPPHTLFILCTTEAHKVPDTIISRCFHVQFQKATAEEIVHSLERIVKGEKLDVEQDALEYIAKMSDGAFRDGAKILEEVLLLSNGKKITKELVEEKYKSTNVNSYIERIVNSFNTKNAKEGFQIIDEISQQGVDMKYLIQELIGTLHTSLLMQVQTENQNLDDLRKLIELLARANSELRYAVIPQLPLELAIVEWCNGNSNSKIDQSEKKETVAKVQTNAPASVQAVNSNGGKNDKFWYQFLDAVKKENNLVAGVLRSCRLGSYEKETLIITTKFPFHSEKLNDNVLILEKAAQSLTGKPTKVSIQLN